MKKNNIYFIIVALIICLTSCGEKNTDGETVLEGSSNDVITVSDAKAFKSKGSKNEVGSDDIINYLSSFYPERTIITKVHDVSQEKGETDQKMTVACSVDVSNQYAGCMTNWTVYFERFNDAWRGIGATMGLYETTIREDIDLDLFAKDVKQHVDDTSGMFGLFDNIDAVLDTETGKIYITFESFRFDQYLCNNAPYTVEYTFNDNPSKLSWHSNYYNVNKDPGKTLNIWGLAGHYESEYGDKNPWACDVVKENGVYRTCNFIWSNPSFGYSGKEPEQDIIFTGYDIQLTNSSGGRANQAPLAAIKISGDTLTMFVSTILGGQSVLNNNLPLDFTDIPEKLWMEVANYYGATSYVLGDNITDNSDCSYSIPNDKSLDPASHPSDGLRIELNSLDRYTDYTGDSYRFWINYDIINESELNINEFYGLLFIYDDNGKYLLSIPRRKSGAFIEANHIYHIQEFFDLSGPVATYLYSINGAGIKYEFMLDSIEYEDGFKLSHMISDNVDKYLDVMMTEAETLKPANPESTSNPLVQSEVSKSSSEPAILSNTDFPILVYTLENINIRKGPGKNNAKEGKVYADSIITLYESQKIGDEYTWYRVNAYADHWIADNGQWIRKLNSQEEEIYKNSLFADYDDYFPSEGSLYKVAESFDSYYWIWTGEGGCGVLIQSKDNPSSVVNESQSYDLLYDLYDKNDRKPVHFYQIYDNGRMPLKDADGQYEGVEWHVVREGKDIAYTYIYFEEIDMVKDVVEGASDQALKAKGYERIR